MADGMRGVRGRRGLLVALLAAAALAGGCLDGGVDGLDGRGAEPLRSLALYEYRYPGDGVQHPDHPYGWMVRLTNVAAAPVQASVQPESTVDLAWGPVGQKAWGRTGSAPVTIAPGESVLYLFEWRGGPLERVAYEVRVVAAGGAEGGEPAVLEAETRSRSLGQAPTHRPVAAGDHVRTATVGVWVNGTSFYTNIAALDGDPAFPAGYDRAGFGAGLLPVYVYDAQTWEQPAGSKDTCHFVTIEGYNALLKTQAEKTTNVRFLTPEEAYTREGNEDHALFGDALVFLNTVVAHDGSVSTVAGLPDPQGECFDPTNASPVPVPDPPF